MFIMEAHASDVLIEADGDYGQGFFVKAGSECLVYTPKHVIADSADIFINSMLHKDIEVSVLTSFSADLAILQVPKQYENMCEKAHSLKKTEYVEDLLENNYDAKLIGLKKNGSKQVMSMDITSKAMHSFFLIKPNSSNSTIRKGMSGSLVKINNLPVGMLLSVQGNQGKVLRTDTIFNITKSVLQNFDNTYRSKGEVASINKSLEKGNSVEYEGYILSVEKFDNKIDAYNFCAARNLKAPSPADLRRLGRNNLKDIDILISITKNESGYDGHKYIPTQRRVRRLSTTSFTGATSVCKAKT